MDAGLFAERRGLNGRGLLFRRFRGRRRWRRYIVFQRRKVMDPGDIRHGAKHKSNSLQQQKTPGCRGSIRNHTLLRQRPGLDRAKHRHYPAPFRHNPRQRPFSEPRQWRWHIAHRTSHVKIEAHLATSQNGRRKCACDLLPLLSGLGIPHQRNRGLVLMAL